MPRRNLSKDGGIAKPSDNTGKLLKVGLYRVSSDGTVSLTDEKGTFLLNPSNYTESKTTNWQAHNIPGQSNPVHQWISGGPRQVTFDALVTRDSSDFDKKTPSLLGGLVDKGLEVVGSIASEFAGVSIPPLDNLFSTTAAPGTKLSIADKLGYYRSLQYPIYSSNYSALIASPPLLVLVAGRTFSDEQPNKMVLPTPGSPYLPIWVLTSLSIKITKQLPNLDPMEAIVSFGLEEYSSAPPSANSFEAKAGSGLKGNLSILGFDLGISSPF